MKRLERLESANNSAVKASTLIIDIEDSIDSTSNLTDCELKRKIVEKKKRNQKFQQKLEEPLTGEAKSCIPNLPHFEEHSKKKQF